MSRSIHSTKKQRLRERRYLQTDGVPPSDGMTALEREGHTKDVHKINSDWKKQADKFDAPIYAKLKLGDGTPGSIARDIRRRKQKEDLSLRKVLPKPGPGRCLR
jgi:hypothetical protein